MTFWVAKFLSDKRIPDVLKYAFGKVPQSGDKVTIDWINYLIASGKLSRAVANIAEALQESSFKPIDEEHSNYPFGASICKAHKVVDEKGVEKVIGLFISLEPQTVIETNEGTYVVQQELENVNPEEVMALAPPFIIRR